MNGKASLQRAGKELMRYGEIVEKRDVGNTTLRIIKEICVEETNYYLVSMRNGIVTTIMYLGDEL